MTDAILAAAVLVAMAGLAVHDARRALVDPRLVLALLGAAAAWRFGGGGPEADGTWPRLAAGVLGASLGVAAVMVPIGAAELLGRRWPLYPGDAMLLGAMGFLLGPLGLAWSMALGSGAGLIYRFCVQRKRGRHFRKGLVPLGPGMCAGAAAVFLCMNFGIALAGDGGAESEERLREDGRSVTASPLPSFLGTDGALHLPATELAPVPAGLPPELAGRVVSVEESETLPFPALVRRLAAVAGTAMRIEERPARIEGGAAVLADPPALRLAWQGPLAGLLDRVAALKWLRLVLGDTCAGDPRAGDTRARERRRGVLPLLGCRAARPAARRRNRRFRQGRWRRAGNGRLDRRSGRAPGPCAGCWRAGRRAPAGRWSGRRARTTAWARRRGSRAASWRPPTSC